MPATPARKTACETDNHRAMKWQRDDDRAAEKPHNALGSGYPEPTVVRVGKIGFQPTSSGQICSEVRKSDQNFKTELPAFCFGVCVAEAASDHHESLARPCRSNAGRNLSMSRDL